MDIDNIEFEEKRIFTEAEHEAIIASIAGSWRIEGLELNEKDKEEMRAVFRGEITTDELVNQIIKEFK